MDLLRLDRLVRRVRPSRLRLALMGQSFIALALGSTFSLSLVRYGYFLFIGATLLATISLNNAFASWHAGREQTYGSTVLGLLSSMLLMLFLGIQSPQIPAKGALMALGILLMIPAHIACSGGEGLL